MSIEQAVNKQLLIYHFEDSNSTCQFLMTRNYKINYGVRLVFWCI